MKGILSYFPPVVIDNGSGFTKAGFAGNAFPSAVFESATVRDGQRSKVSPVLDFTSVSCVDTDFPRKLNSSTFPIKHGIVEDWNAMENIWHSCFFDELRCNPQDHYVLLTESPLNTPENREEAAEIMFETFNVPGMQISIQAILSLIASSCVTNNNNNKWIASSDLTGCVIDSGSGVTQIIPVVNGHVMSSCIEQIEMGGRDVTAYVQQLLRERKEPIPSDVSIEAARIVKERYAYTCPDIEKECRRFDSNPEKITTTFTSCHQRSGLPWSMNIQYERFLAPEIVINPKIFSPSFKKTLPELVDSAISNCPIDTRRHLYKNIVLSGGNTSFKNFNRRLQKDIRNIVQDRLNSFRGEAGKQHLISSSDVQVNVKENIFKTHSVWIGGSILASSQDFFDQSYTRAQFEEEGPRIFRQNVAFRAKL